MANENAPKCGCFCHRAGGLIVLLIGLDFLLGNLDVLGPRIVGIIWPVLIILLGLKGLGKCRCCADA